MAEILAVVLRRAGAPALPAAELALAAGAAVAAGGTGATAEGWAKTALRAARIAGRPMAVAKCREPTGSDPDNIYPVRNDLRGIKRSRRPPDPSDERDLSAQE